MQIQGNVSQRMIRMDGRIHVEGIEEGVTGDSAYAGSGVYPDQGGLPSRGRPSDFGVWRASTSTLGKQKREVEKFKREYGTLLTL